MNLVAVDVGYADTKAVTARKQVIFPSVIAPYTDNPLEGVFKNGAGHKVEWQDTKEKQAKNTLVGEAALNSLSATVTLSRNKPAGIHDLLVMTAVSLCGLGGNEEFLNQINLAVGLPLAYFKSQREGLKSRMEGLSAWISVDGVKPRYLSFNRVLVLPQATGAVLAGGVDFNTIPEGYIALLDIGRYTTDYLLLENRGSLPIPLPEACGSTEAGVHLVQRALASEFQKQTGTPLAARMQRKIMEAAAAGKPVRYQGRSINLSDTFLRSREEVAQQIVQDIKSSWGDRADYLAVTILAGGGSVLFQESLLRAFPGAIMAPDPVFANAQGFLHMLGGL